MTLEEAIRNAVEQRVYIRRTTWPAESCVSPAFLSAILKGIEIGATIEQNARDDDQWELTPVRR